MEMEGCGLPKITVGRGDQSILTQQRHWTAAPRRRSVVVSKSLTMIKRWVARHRQLDRRLTAVEPLADVGAALVGD
jgi:hypothetical protein